MDKEIIGFIHYPPFYKENGIPEEIDFIKTLNKYNVKKCYYAHLHAESLKDAVNGNVNGIEFKLVSSDYLKFNLYIKLFLTKYLQTGNFICYNKLSIIIRSHILNKKGRIIFGSIVLVLIVAAIIIILTTTLNGGAAKKTTTQFISYMENAQYFKEDKDGKYNPNGVRYAPNLGTGEYEGKIVSASKSESEEGYVLDGYKVVEGKIVTDDEKESPLIVIWKVELNSYEYKGYTYSDKNDRMVLSYYCYGPSQYGSEGWDQIKSFGVEVDMANPNAGSWVSTLFSVLSIVIVCVVFFLIIRASMGGGGKMMSFAKTKARVTTNIKVRFTDVAGAEEEKVELAEIVEFLRQPKKFSDLGARIPKGVLLVGPPGTGKTLFAKAVAGEAGVPFFSVSGSDFVEMYVGVGASRVRDLFEMAKKNQPCIIFIDEIDAVGRHRGAGLGGGNDEREQTLNQILVQMDGFESNEGVIVIAATNRSDILDPALMRPGRFDRQVFVNLPDVKGREQILKVHARNKPLAPDVNLRNVARLSAGFSGADLANLLNEAAILAARANKKFIGNPELYEAFDKVAMGPAKKSKVITEQDKRLTAFHESGHCILAKI